MTPRPMEQRPLELLSPAANADIAIQAILHGADAVYIGPPSHGARKSASNSIEDIARVVEFAHIYRARVYVTVNTVVYDHELKQVEAMIWELWRIGVDAIIVQDMGILRLNIPPIELHASTQCDTRTPEKALFLEKAGFSQIVLARELTIPEIRAITEAVSVPVECFIHGALCVSYSGVCHASQVCFGRSANRGECAQMCRMKYDLTDADGKILKKEAHLLSLKDFNLSDRLDFLVKAGVSSFKIEGRLKEMSYVKNITANYDRILNDIVRQNPELYRRSSFGSCVSTFEPNPEKSFNRGFTHYFIDSRRPTGIYEPRTPKSLGEPIKKLSDLNNGDGISWFDSKGEYVGMQVNSVSSGKVKGPKGFLLPKGTVVHRTADVKWDSTLQKETGERKLNLDITIDDTGISAADERGVKVRLPFDVKREKANKPMDFRRHFEKLGNTPYKLRAFQSYLPEDTFIPASELAACRRSLVTALDKANASSFPLERRRKEEKGYPYPESRIDFKGNVCNRLAREFYADHHVTSIEKGAELMASNETEGMQVMTTRHCILRELGMCLKKKGTNVSDPLFLRNGVVRFRLGFDCDRCEMQLFKA